jgi:hypothetical protein
VGFWFTLKPAFLDAFSFPTLELGMAVDKFVCQSGNIPEKQLLA